MCYKSYGTVSILRDNWRLCTIWGSLENFSGYLGSPAPSCVDFFSKKHTTIRHKISTATSDEITEILRRALQGISLSQFSDKDRFSWIEHRHTKIEENRASSLLGIFGIEMPLRYREESAGAFQRLRMDSELNSCLHDLCPRIRKAYGNTTSIGGLIRRLFRREVPKAITIRPHISESWNACL
jgi:hypothetical protein